MVYIIEASPIKGCPNQNAPSTGSILIESEIIASK
jgi:hypothetical protein